ncbi:MAG: TolC family protein [Planctomycetia bacterium]|nr:TolC family protein [Planctomycetia bacterium]
MRIFAQAALVASLSFLAGRLAWSQETPPPAEPPPAADAKVDPFEGDPRKRVKMSLEDCLRAALDANLDLAYSRLEPDLYRGDILGWKGPYDPVVYAETNQRRSKSATSSSLAGAAVLKDRLWTTSVGLRGSWFLGTTYDFNFATQRDDTNNSFATIDPRWDSSVGFSLRQPLLRNAWLDHNLITLRLYENSYRSSVHHVSQDTIATLYEVELAYWTLVDTINQKGVKLRTLEVSQRLYEVNRNKVRAGALAPIEELRAESDVASRKEGIILAANAIENAMDELRRLIRPFDRPEDWNFILEPSDTPAFEPRAVDVDAAVSEAVNRRPELEQLRLAIDSSRLDVRRIERDRWPSLDLTGGIRYSGIGGSFGDSLESLRTWDYSTWEVGVVFEYPLGSRSSRGQLFRAEVQQRRSEIALRNQEQAVVLEVRTAAREMKSTAERIEATRTATRLALRAMEAEQARYERGLTTSHQLLQFLSDAETAAANEQKAIVDYKIAELKLRKATGRLLQERAGR